MVITQYQLHIQMNTPSNFSLISIFFKTNLFNTICFSIFALSSSASNFVCINFIFIVLALLAPEALDLSPLFSILNVMLAQHTLRTILLNFVNNFINSIFIRTLRWFGNFVLLYLTLNCINTVFIHTRRWSDNFPLCNYLFAPQPHNTVKKSGSKEDHNVIDEHLSANFQ